MIIQYCGGDYVRYYWDSILGQSHCGECIQDDLMIAIEQKAEYEYSTYQVYVPKLCRYASVNLTPGQFRVLIK